MKCLVTTLIIVVKLIKDGIYDFYTLPKALKAPLTKEDEEKIMQIPEMFTESKLSYTCKGYRMSLCT